MALLPTEQGAGVEDWVSSLERLEAVAEGSCWSELENGVRLATPVLRGGERVSQALTRAQFEKNNDLTWNTSPTHMLWQNEKAAGEKMLSAGPGLLMKIWDLNERTPSGWERSDLRGSRLMRV